MSTDYPGAIDSYTTKTDGVDSVMAAHINDLQDAVVAIETALGANFNSDPKFKTDADLTIASGEVTITQGYHRLICETGTTDTLSTINGGADGKLIALRPKNSGDTITLDTAGNIAVGVVLDSQSDIAFLIYSSALSKWCLINAAGAGVAADPIWAAKGDIAVATADNTAQAVSAGSNGQKLVAASAETAGVKWIDDTFSWNIPFDTSSTGVKFYGRIPYNCTITSVELVGDQSGSLVVDIWVDAWANFPPTDADSITFATPPTLSGAQKVQDTSLTSWTKDLTAGSWLGINVDSVTTITWAVLAINGKKTAVA